MTNNVTNQDLYEAISRLEDKILDRVVVLENDVKRNTAWINQITGKITVVMIFVGAGINYLWDMFFNKK